MRTRPRKPTTWCTERPLAGTVQAVPVGDVVRLVSKRIDDMLETKARLAILVVRDPAGVPTPLGRSRYADALKTERGALQCPPW